MDPPTGWGEESKDSTPILTVANLVLLQGGLWRKKKR